MWFFSFTKLFWPWTTKMRKSQCWYVQNKVKQCKIQIVLMYDPDRSPVLHQTKRHVWRMMVRGLNFFKRVVILLSHGGHGETVITGVCGTSITGSIPVGRPTKTLSLATHVRFRKTFFHRRETTARSRFSSSFTWFIQTESFWFHQRLSFQESVFNQDVSPVPMGMALDSHCIKYSYSIVWCL